MSEDHEFVETEEKNWTPEDHYQEAMRLLSISAGGDLMSTNVLIRALTHMVGAAIRDALDYTAGKETPTPIDPALRFEEDEDRP
jgi:hypothetical protein